MATEEQGDWSLAGVRAVLLDMDGTLVDSTVVVEELWTCFAARFSLDPDEVITYAHGRVTGDTVSRFAPRSADVATLIDDQERAELELLDGIAAIDGAAEFLGELKGFPTAVVTSAPRELARRRLTAAGLAIPACLIVSEDVAAGKPDPEGYLLAARALGVQPSAAVVVEDSAAGIRAGLSAGASVIEIQRAGRTSGLVEHVVADFHELSVPRVGHGEAAINRASDRTGPH